MRPHYQGQQIVIVGLGSTGLSCLDFFFSRGIVPRVMDTRVNPPCLNSVPAGVNYHLGGFNEKWLMTADVILLSPGISLAHPMLQAASKKGIDIIGDIELFCREIPPVPVVAVTGSNGKSTVTTLVTQMAQTAGWPVSMGGNIGIPALKLLKQKSRLIVLELSSFQLETTHTLAAKAATVLNITEDHADRYPLGVNQYQAAKLRIYQNAHTAVINADDPLTLPRNGTQKSATKFEVSFGLNQGQYRLHQDGHDFWLQASDQNVLNTKDMKLIGKHNYLNALAALALADAVDIPREASLKALIEYKGLPHRFEKIFEKNGICWINDSKATNVGSTLAAIKSVQCQGTLHLLLGGQGKSADFSILQPDLNQNRIQIYCFGQDAETLAALRPEVAQRTETLEQAMKLLKSRLKKGDTVLLSPACASFDQFSDFEQRGQEFSHLAKELGA